MTKVDEQKKVLTVQEHFDSEVGDALERAFEELDLIFETVNLVFARDVKFAASKHGMSLEQIEASLSNYAQNDGHISIGPGKKLPGAIAVLDVLRYAYESLLGEGYQIRRDDAPLKNNIVN